MSWKTAYLSLGSNLDDRAENLRRALELLASPDLRITRTSSLYETEPQDLRQQPWFLNLAAEIETTLFPMPLLARIQSVEKQLGRKRIVSKGPRTIDIDILLFGGFVIDTPSLTSAAPPHGATPLRPGASRGNSAGAAASRDAAADTRNARGNQRPES